MSLLPLPPRWYQPPPYPGTDVPMYRWGTIEGPRARWVCGEKRRWRRRVCVWDDGTRDGAAMSGYVAQMGYSSAWWLRDAWTAPVVSGLSETICNRAVPRC